MITAMASNSSYSEIPECPLCLEPLGLDDINFYPCSCRYQICRFCWHRIRTDENGLCPHCREMYSENPAEYTPPTADQLAKLKSDKKQKEQFKRQKVVENREKLASVRVIQRNLVFVIGLSTRLADSEVLKKNEFFGKYGKIYKVVINNHTIYNGAQGPSVSAYVTYCRNEDASKAIAAVNNAFIDGRSLKASFGTTKYCTSFLKGTLCTKPDCMYLHELGEDEASFTKEDMQLGKHQVFEHATLTSLLTGGSGGTKEHTPSLVVEGVPKVKPLAPQRSRDSGLSDAIESALPSTSHWAQKIHSGPDTTSLDVSHSQSKQSDSVATATSGKGVDANADVHSEQSLGPNTEHLPSEGTPLKTSKKVPRPQHGMDWEDTRKSGSRSESLSPTIQRTDQSRSLELSPQSTMSASSSLDSLGGLEGVNDAIAPPGPAVSVSSLWKESSLERAEVRSGEGGRMSGEIWEEDSLGNWSSSIEIGKSEDDGVTGTKRITSFPGADLTGGSDLERDNGHFARPLAPHGSSPHTFSRALGLTRRQDEEASKQSICSPPGLSKKKQASVVASEQPLTLSEQSEKVLELEEETAALYLGNSQSRLEYRNDLTGWKKGAGESRDGGDDADSPRPLASSNNALSGTGTGHSSAMGTKWRFHHPHNPPTHSNIASQYSLKHSQNPQPTLSPSKPPQLASSSSMTPHSSTFPVHTRLDRVDDADELGFDPCVVSQQGLADLLETEAEQQHQWQQNAPLPYSAHAHSLERALDHGHSTSTGGSKKGFPNGIISSLSEHSGGSFYGKWPGASHPTCTSSVAVDCMTLPSSNDSLRDEFRALFPNVNISFGGSSTKTKMDKPSSLVQALDDSNPSMSSFLFPSSSNASHHPCSSSSSSSHHPHPSTNTQRHYPAISLATAATPHLSATNSFLGRSQPGFPSSCLRVQDHDDGVTPSSSTSSSSIGTCGSPAYSSSSSCLGPEWPGLGIAVAQMNKGQNKSASLMEGSGGGLSQSSPLTMGVGGNQDPLMAGIGGNRIRSSPLVTGAGGSQTQLASMMTGAGVNVSQSSPLLTGGAVNGSAGNGRSSWKAPAGISVSVATTTGSSVSNMTSSLPSPPPGFSKTTPNTNHTLGDGTGAAAGAGNQTSSNATPALLMNNKGQMVPNHHLVQAWNNMRSLAGLSPAQQQQLARNNQLTYQQLLTQQYIFQQAMLRNPQALLQAHSIRMAQLQQQAMQHQQQQKLLAAAVGTTTGSGFSTLFSVGPVNTQSASKLLMTMAGASSSATPGSLPAATASTTSATQSGQFIGPQGTVDGTGGSIGESILKFGSKPRQNVASNGVEGQFLQTDDARVSGQTIGSSNATRLSTTSEVLNGPIGQQNSSSKMGEVRQSKNKISAKSKSGQGTFSSSSSAGSDKISRLKSFK